MVTRYNWHVFWRNLTDWNRYSEGFSVVSVLHVAFLVEPDQSSQIQKRESLFRLSASTGLLGCWETRWTGSVSRHRTRFFLVRLMMKLNKKAKRRIYKAVETGVILGNINDWRKAKSAVIALLAAYVCVNSKRSSSLVSRYSQRDKAL